MQAGHVVQFAGWLASSTDKLKRCYNVQAGCVGQETDCSPELEYWLGMCPRIQVDHAVQVTDWSNRGGKCRLVSWLRIQAGHVVFMPAGQLIQATGLSGLGCAVF
jgi:hypothetical protein